MVKLRDCQEERLEPQFQNIIEESRRETRKQLRTTKAVSVVSITSFNCFLCICVLFWEERSYWISVLLYYFAVCTAQFNQHIFNTFSLVSFIYSSRYYKFHMWTSREVHAPVGLHSHFFQISCILSLLIFLWHISRVEGCLDSFDLIGSRSVLKHHY